MAKSVAKQNREILENRLVEKGWEKDRWGHYKLDHKGKTFRFKMQKTSVRVERKYEGGWLLLANDYFGKLKIDENTIYAKGLKIL